MVSSRTPRYHGGPTVITRAASKSPNKQDPPTRTTTTSTTHQHPLPSKINKAHLRKPTPLRRKGSPIKFPLPQAPTPHLNKTPPRIRGIPYESPTDRYIVSAPYTMQKANRAGIGVENGSPESPLANRGSSVKSGSPTKSSPMGPEETVDTSAVLRGTPIPKRRTSQGYGLYTINSPFGSSPTSPTRSAITKSPKRGTAKKSSQFLAPPPDRPIFARSRPQSRHLGFATPSEPASRIRRIASVGDFLSRNSLPNASTQRRTPAVNNEPTPGGEDTTTNGNGTNGNAIGLDWVTPRNYQEAKPDPAAFHSTGFIPKRGRMSLGDSSTSIHQPDTPSKKTNPFLASSNSVPNIAAPRKEFSHPTLDGRPIIPAKSTMVNINVSRRQAPFRGAGDDVSPTAAFGRRRKPDDVADSGLPPTPTKPVYSNVNLSTIFGNVGGTKRKNTSRPQSPYSIAGRANRAFITGSPSPVKDDNDPFPNASQLSLDGARGRPSEPPCTPPPRAIFSSPEFNTLRQPRTPTFLPLEQSPSLNITPNMTWRAKFSEVRMIGTGEFSQVYLAVDIKPKRLFEPAVTATDKIPGTPQRQLASPRTSSPFDFPSPSGANSNRIFYAVKKSKTPYTGVRDRDRRLEEVRVLRELKGHDHVIRFVDSWEEDRFIYIQTEYCDNGSLDKFLDLHGSKGRLDEFRVWKVMIELLLGVKHIHACGFMHLDIKPANVFITFDGSLKIGDFGMATRWPAASGIEREGDREYIAPEVIQSNRYDKPVDIFSLGLTIIETAGNEALPPNGPVWQSLRSGDLSTAPILSTSVSGEFVVRDEMGNPVSTELLETHANVSADSSFESDNGEKGLDVLGNPSKSSGLLSPSMYPKRRRAFYRTLSGSKKLLHVPRAGDAIYAPKFMELGGLERIVQLMLRPKPGMRPTAKAILEMEEVKWVDQRRKAPATVFEGLWGPKDKGKGVEVQKEEAADEMECDHPMMGSECKKVGEGFGDWNMEM